MVVIVVIAAACSIVRPYPARGAAIPLLIRRRAVPHGVVVHVSAPPARAAARPRPRVAPGRLVVVAVACRLVFHARADAEDLEHACRRAAKDDHGQNDHDEHGRAQRLGGLAFESGRERDADGATQAGPEQHHLVRMRELFVSLPAEVSREEVDELRKREHGDVARKHHRDCRHGDEKRLDIAGHAFRSGRACEKGESEVDEDEVLRELGESREDVLGCALCLARHSMVCIVLQGDATKKE